MFSPKIRFQILGWVKKKFDYQILLNLKTWAQAFEYNGQRALVLDTGPDNADSDGTPESVPRRVTVELMRSGQRMSLRRDKFAVRANGNRLGGAPGGFGRVVVGMGPIGGLGGKLWWVKIHQRSFFWYLVCIELGLFWQGVRVFMNVWWSNLLSFEDFHDFQVGMDLSVIKSIDV